jgi:hypothetical protein
VYIYGANFAPVALHVIVNCIGNNTQSSLCYENSIGITLNDTHLLKSPKLKESLVKVLTAKPFFTNPRMYTVNLTMAEFESMNRTLVSTNQDALRNYSQNQNPTLKLFPKGSSIVFINYNGNSYQLIPSYPTFHPFGQLPD